MAVIKGQRLGRRNVSDSQKVAQGIRGGGGGMFALSKVETAWHRPWLLFWQ